MAVWNMRPTVMVVVLSVLYMYCDTTLAISCPTPMLGLDRCDCGWEAHSIINITCENLGHTNHHPLQNLAMTPDITKLIYIGNNIRELESNIFGDCSRVRLLKLTYIDLSRNNIETIHGQSFHCVPNVETLLLNYNQWNVDPNKVRVFSSMPRLNHLELHNAFNNKTNDNTISIYRVFNGSAMGFLHELHLEDNGIQFIGRTTFCSLRNLQVLNLSGNKLNKIHLDCLDKLQKLYLLNNLIESLGDEDMKSLENMPDLAVLDLSHNPFQCNDCSTRTADFRDWLLTQRPYVVERENLQCTNDELKDRKIIEVTDKDLKNTCYSPLQLTKKKSNTREITTGVILGIIAILTVIFLYVNRVSIKKATSKWIQPIRSSSFMKRMHFGYANMNNDKTDMFSNLEHDDDATFARMGTDDATRYASMENGDPGDYPELSNEDATTYPNMEGDDRAPVVT